MRENDRVETENTEESPESSEQSQETARSKLRDLKPEKDPMGAAKKTPHPPGS